MNDAHPSPPPIGTRRDELLRFPAAITSASDAELDLVLGRVDRSIAPGTLDALLERTAAALRRARSEVAGSIASRGDDDAWTAAINAATLATRARSDDVRATPCGSSAGRRRPIANDDGEDGGGEADESGGVAPRDPAVFGFMAAVVDVVAGGADERAPRGRHVDAPKAYALRVARAAELPSKQSPTTNRQAVCVRSNAPEYYSDSKRLRSVVVPVDRGAVRERNRRRVRRLRRLDGRRPTGRPSPPNEPIATSSARH